MVRIGPLDLKILRDAWHMRGQVVACALVVAGGINSFVSLSSVNRSLAASQAVFYETHRFADVFADLVRAPEHVAASLAAIPGVAVLDTRLSVRVNLDVPGLAEPARGRIISISRDPAGGLNTLHLRKGRMPAQGSQEEVLAAEAFAVANHLEPGDAIRGVMNGRYNALRVVGVANSPEFIYALGPGQLVPDNQRFGILWMDRKGLEKAYDMEGAFNSATARVAPGASIPATLGEIDRVLAPYGGVGAYDREDQLSHRFLSDEIAQNRTMSRVTPTIFLAVAAFLLYMVLTRLVQLQRSQVGLLKAFGYSGAEIALHYLKLALVISLLGAAIGVVTGLPFARAMLDLYAEYYYFPMTGGDQRAAVAAAGSRARGDRRRRGSDSRRASRRATSAGAVHAARAAGAFPRRGAGALGPAARPEAGGQDARAKPRAAAAALPRERHRHRHRGLASRDADRDARWRALPHGLAVQDRAARGRAGGPRGTAVARRARFVPGHAWRDASRALPDRGGALPRRPPPEARAPLRARGVARPAPGGGGRRQGPRDPDARGCSSPASLRRTSACALATRSRWRCWKASARARRCWWWASWTSRSGTRATFRARPPTA